MADYRPDEAVRASLGLHRGRRALGVVVLLTSALLVSVWCWPEARALPMQPLADEPSAPPVSVPPAAKPRVKSKTKRAPVTKQPPAAAPSVVVAEPPVEPAPLEPAPVEAEPAPVAAQPLVEAAPETEAPADAPPPPPPPEVEEATEPEAMQLDGNAEAIARALAASKRAAVRACFEHELKTTPKLTGNVVVELDLAPPNRLDDVRVSDDLERPEFTRCVLSAMRSVRFTGLNEETSVRVPYVLTPERRRTP